MRKRKQKYLTIIIFSILISAVSYRETNFSSAADAPTYLTPADGSYTNNPVIFFSWSPVAGALSYDLEYSFNSGFIGSVTRNIIAPQTNFTLPEPGFSEDRTYYWRVATNDIGGSGDLEQSPVWTFILDTEDPEQPVLLSPINDTHINDSTPFFDWYDTPGAYDYRILVDENPLFLSPNINDTTLDSEYQSLVTLPMDGYYWTVQARDEADNFGLWSERFYFYLDLVPPGQVTLNLPANDTISNGIGWIEWFTEPDTDIYHYEVGNNPSFDVIYESGTTDLTLYVLGLSDGTYFWRIKAEDLAGNHGPWSETWMFTQDSTGPAAPLLSSPANNTYTNVTSVRFEWTIVEPADEWELALSYDEDFTFPSYHTTANNYLDFPSLSEESVYWKVRGRDTLMNYGPWSGVRVVIIDISEPAAPNVTLPSMDFITNDYILRFEWEYLLEIVDYYEILVSQYANYSVTYYSQQINDSNGHTSTSPFDDSTYYWKLRAVDLAGNLGNWTESNEFEVDTTPPAEVILLLPNHEQLLGHPLVNFTWVALPDAVIYRLIVDNNDDFSSPEIQVDLNETYYNLTTVLADGTYHWNVRAQDAAGNWGLWGQARYFVIDTVVVSEFDSLLPLYISSLLVMTIFTVKQIIKNRRKMD